jgi:hypothetical protein
VPDVTIAYRPARKEVWQYTLEHPPVDQPLGVTTAAGLLALPNFEAPAISVVTQQSDWLAVASSGLEAPYEGLAQLQVRRGGGISGVVVGASGPVAGATVQVQVNSSFLFSQEQDELPKPSVFDLSNMRFAQTDQEGRFSIHGLLKSTETLRILADGYALMRHDFKGPDPGTQVDLGFLFLEPGIDVTFHFTSPSSLPPGTRLFLSMKGDQATRGAEGLVLDADGNVVVEDLVPGKYQWNLERPGALCAAGEISLTKKTQDVRIRVAATRVLEVMVRSEDGQAIKGAIVSARESGGRSFRTEVDGSALLSCSEGKSVYVKVRAPGFVRSKRVTVPATEDSLEVVLQRLGELRIHLLGMDERQILLLGTQSQETRKRINPFVDPAWGVSFQPYPIQDSTVLVPDLEPGVIFVLLDLGAGPEVFGPFVVQAASVESVEIEVQLPREISVVVRDKNTQAPVAGAEVRHAKPGSHDFARTFGKMLGVETPAVALSDRNGQFSTWALPAQASSFSIVAPHYETAVVQFDPSVPQPYVVELEALPSAPLRVFFMEGQAAAHAMAGFLSIEDSLPSSIASVLVDENGAGLIDSVPTGNCQPRIDFQYSKEVRYRVEFPIQRIFNDQALELVLVESPGWLSLRELPQGGPATVTICSNHAGGTQDTIRCKASWWQTPRTPLPVTPGFYRITALQGKNRYSASCTVRAGETTTVVWNNLGVGQIVVEMVGGDWATCQLELQAEDGDFVGQNRHFVFERTAAGVVLENLAAGKYLVRLVAWTDLRGQKHQPSWSQRTVVGELPGAVQFQLGSAATASIRVVDEKGTPLKHVVVVCAAVDGEVINLVDGLTDQNGLVDLLLPLGEVVFRASRGDRGQTETRFRHSGEGEFTLVCPSRN